MAIVTAAFVLIAVLASFLRPVVHTAEARLAVGSGQMTALNIPGFPSASEEMASNYARWVSHQGVQGRWAPEGTLSLSASPIVESNVLRIEATSHDEDIAVEAAQQASDNLIETVNEVASGNDPDALLQDIESNVRPLTEARIETQRIQDVYEEGLEDGQPQIEVERRFEAFVTAEAALTVMELEQDARRDRYRSLVASRSTEAELVDVSPAQIVSDDRFSVIQRNGLLGLLVGLGASTVLVLLRERRRLRGDTDTAVETVRDEAQDDAPGHG
ncbi:hypothetical protein ACI3EY_13115 [Ornithinimicrobium sp. LYQ92]|uniref:hypothetical protein n=1 Tax=Serinicoccus sp. LYQ92 TaxID=3378798 RepID=UPI0038546989